MHIYEGSPLHTSSGCAAGEGDAKNRIELAIEPDSGLDTQAAAVALGAMTTVAGPGDVPSESINTHDIMAGVSELGRAEDLAPEPDGALGKVRLSDDNVRGYLREITKTPLLDAEQEVQLAMRIEAGVLARAVLDGEYNYPKYDPSTATSAMRHELEWLGSDGEAAKNHLISANLRLVVSIAKRYGNHGLDLIDLIQEGSIGLMRAVEKYDFKQGNKFSTYAVWWIRQAITRAIADKGHAIRKPIHTHEKVIKLSQIEAEALSQTGFVPTDEELADAMGVTAERVRDLRSWRPPVVSLDTSIVGADDGVVGTIGDTVVDESTPGPSEAPLAEDAAMRLKSAIGMLPEMEQHVLSLKFGDGGGRPRSTREVAEIVGMTRASVDNILQRALSQLRHPSQSRNLRGLLGGSAVDVGGGSWQDEALCAQIGPAAFYPQKGGSVRAAKSVCRSCEQREACLEDALECDDHHGVWGGLSERERFKSRGIKN